jgi:hypothetical protein
MDPEIIQGGLMQNLGMDEGTAYRYAAEISASPELYGDVLARIGLSDGFQTGFRAANDPRAVVNRSNMTLADWRNAGDTFVGALREAFNPRTDTLGMEDTGMAAASTSMRPTEDIPMPNLGQFILGGIADPVGIGEDIANTVANPSLANLGLTALGMLPFVPAGMTRAVGRTDPLMMVHNQYQAALPKTSTLGGIPGPSVAITKPDIGLGQFGDISWIFDPEYAKRMSGGQTFARDAYTPRSPYVQPSFSLQARKAVSEIAGENNPNTVFGQRLLADKGFPDDILASFVNEVPSRVDRENLAALYGIKPDQVDDRFAENLKQQLFLDLRDRNAPVKYKMRQETRYDSRQVDATNAKILREMFASGVRGGEYGPINFNRALALVTPELRTIKQVREQSGNIKRVTPTEYARATDEAEKLYTNIYDRIYELSKNNSGLASDAAKDIFRFGRVRDKNLIDIIGSDLGSEFSGDVARFEKMAKEIPTEYFEKKFTKAVPYTAFKGAIIPEDAGPLVTETLEKAGIKHIETYRTPGEREAAFSRFPELLFSAAGAGGIFLASQKPERTDNPDGT